MSCLETLPIQHDIHINKGVAFTGDDLSIEYFTGTEEAWTLKDLTDWTGTMVLKDSLNGTTRLTLSTEDTPAGLVLGGTAGTVTPNITHAQTTALALTDNKGVYQITLYSPDPTDEPLAFAWGNVKVRIF
jgi:hypothetical protein